MHPDFRAKYAIRLPTLGRVDSSLALLERTITAEKEREIAQLLQQHLASQGEATMKVRAMEAKLAAMESTHQFEKTLMESQMHHERELREARWRLNSLGVTVAACVIVVAMMTRARN